MAEIVNQADKLSKFDLIIEAFRNKRVVGLNIEGENKIEEIVTSISHVFLTENKVYKIYMKENETFNKHFTDLGNNLVRKRFYLADFLWNNYFSPHVYLRLLGIKFVEQKITIIEDLDAADDYVIEMDRLNQNDNLYQLLTEHKITNLQVKKIGFDFLTRLDNFPENLIEKKELEKYSEETLLRLNDLENWLRMCGGTFDETEINKVMWRMREYVKKYHLLFDSEGKIEYGVTLDCHTHNLYLVANNLEMIDVYSPKVEWEGGSFLINIYRIGADIFVLSGREAYNSFIEGCKKVREMNRARETFYLAYSALIKGPYIYSLNPTDKESVEIAFKYKEFALDRLKELNI